MKWWKPLQRIRESFVVRISMVLIFVVLVLAFLFDILLIGMQRQAYERENNKHGLALVRLLAQSVKVAVFTENSEDFLVPVSSILSHEDVIEADIFNSDGKLLFSRKKQDNSMAGLLADPKRLQAVFQEVGKAGEKHWQTENSFIFWWPIYFDRDAGSDEILFFETPHSPPEHELIGYAALVFSKHSFIAGVREILINTGVVVLCFLAAGIAMCFVVVRRMIRPLSHILDRIRENTGEAGSRDDLSLLTETYGGLIRELELSFATIKELKDGLEIKVTERTRELSSRRLELEAANQKLSETLVKLREAQKQLVQSEKMVAMGQMVAGVAHEINNSINFVSGALPSIKRLMADLKKLLAGYEGFDNLQHADELDKNIAAIHSLKDDIDFAGLFDTFDLLLANIEEGTRRTTRIVSDLRGFARQGAEKFSAVDINGIIDSSFPFIDGKLRQDVTIVKEYGAVDKVNCLPGRISQVFLNIMLNAVQAMEGRGTLGIRTWQENDWAHVTFADTGCGIEDELLPRIFEPFFTTKEVGRGTGLGLGISYDIIRQHGGWIDVDSTVGAGTVFEVVLPLCPPAIPASKGD